LRIEPELGIALAALYITTSQTRKRHGRDTEA
jgi:hypothetical protein